MDKNVLFENLLIGFEMEEPYLFEQMVNATHTGQSELTIELDDGRVVIYDELMGSTRFLPLDRNNMTDDEYKTEFSLRLNKLMRLRGFTQTTLAEATGCTQPQISNYMRGTAVPGYYKVVRIAKVLNCSLDDLTYI